jgi:hypothetical protein
MGTCGFQFCSTPETRARSPAGGKANEMIAVPSVVGAVGVGLR